MLHQTDANVRSSVANATMWRPNNIQECLHTARDCLQTQSRRLYRNQAFSVASGQFLCNVYASDSSLKNYFCFIAKKWWRYAFQKKSLLFQACNLIQRVCIRMTDRGLKLHQIKLKLQRKVHESRVNHQSRQWLAHCPTRVGSCIRAVN